MGDEIGRTQSGNNNAYCQDNEMNWLQWEGIGGRDAAFFDFVRGLVKLRKTHRLLHQFRFLHGKEVKNGIADILWLRPDGQEMQDEDWSGERRSMAMLLSTETVRTMLFFNAHFENVDFLLPGEEAAKGWRVLVDTNAGLIEPKGEPIGAGETIAIPPRSLIVLEGAP
jgi:glycogen operon protein